MKTMFISLYKMALPSDLSIDSSLDQSQAPCPRLPPAIANEWLCLMRNIPSDSAEWLQPIGIDPDGNCSIE